MLVQLTFPALLADVPFVIVVRGPLVRLQVGPLTERRAAHLALERPLAGVRALVVPDLRLACELLAALAAHERLDARVDDRVHLQIVHRAELLAAQVARELLEAAVRALVLRQVLVAEERLRTLAAAERTRSHLVRLLVRLERVLAGEVLAAQVADVRAQAQVRVHVLVQQVLAAVLLAARLARPRLVVGVVHPSVDPDSRQKY